jgi:hypothetical protein
MFRLEFWCVGVLGLGRLLSGLEESFFGLVWFGLNRKYKMLEASSMTGIYTVPGGGFCSSLIEGIRLCNRVRATECNQSYGDGRYLCSLCYAI